MRNPCYSAPKEPKKKPMRRFLSLQLLALIISCPSVVVAGPEEAIRPTAGVLLAEEMMRVANQATMSEPLDIVAIEAAVALITEASLLSPNDPSIWRSLHEVAQMADLPTLSNHAITNLLRVSPNQPTAQLARLRDVLDSAQTLEKRMAMYELILSQENRNSIDVHVAARLALDAAYLQRQAGNVPQFARWLAESVARDPSYYDAMTLAAGFFGDETADIYTRAELLAAASLANIQDQTTQIALAEFLMAFGDYQDAQAMYEIILGDGANDPALIPDTLLADIVLSQWAAGKTGKAMDTLLTRQMAVDVKFREQTKQQQPRLNPLELARIHAPLVPKLATVRAAIYASQQDKAQATMALESAISSLLTLSKLYEEQGSGTIIRVVELYLQSAWIVLWLGDDVESAEMLIEQVETGAIINPKEKQRLDGWIAFHKGDIQSAKSKLKTLQDDPAAKVGMALIFLQEGNTKAAALELLSVAKKHGGTILGVWSKNKLQEIIGKQFQIRSEVDELQQLMSGVFQTMDTIASDPRPPIGIELRPSLLTYSPYEPIWVEIEITNNTPIPLTIANTGPIQPLLLLEVVLATSGESANPTPPIIVSIDKEISIKPRGKTSLYIDLRSYWIGGLLNSNPLGGISFSLRATVNFTAREATNRQGKKVLVYESGRLGKQKMSNVIRINGIRVTDQWLEQALEDIQEVSSIQDLITFVILTWVVTDSVTVEVVEPLIPPPPGEEVLKLSEGERHPNQDKAIADLLSTFPKLGSIEQAWVLATMSSDPTVEAVRGMISDSNNPVTQIAWIIRFTTPAVQDEALDDPQLLSAMQSENKHVRDVANWIHDWIQHVVNLRNQSLLSL